MEQLEKTSKKIQEKALRTDKIFVSKNTYPEWVLNIKKDYKSSYVRKDKNGSFRLYQNKSY
jgi:hypothetical protein